MKRQLKITDDLNERIPENNLRAARLIKLVATTNSCGLCDLSGGRTQSVVGDGSPYAGLFVIGEAPGQQEDKIGIPFVGQSGRVQNKVMAKVGFDRKRDAYITNTVKCRPPNNRNPSENEYRKCKSYLEEQLEIIQPSLIVCSGKVAANSMLDCDMSMSDLRRKVWKYKGDYRFYPLVVVYHPAYYLRNKRIKEEYLQDWKYVRKIYNSAIQSKWEEQ